MLDRGLSFPLGATLRDGGVNFSLFSKNASSVELLLFDRAEDARPARVIQLDRRLNRTFHYWHVFVPGLRAGQVYAFRAHGAFDLKAGHRFDGEKILLDPYGYGVTGVEVYDREAAKRAGDNTAHALKSVVIDTSDYDWEGDLPLEHPWEPTVIYEMHVAGFTKHPSSGVEDSRRGTYLGVVDKIPYLKALGITAVELQPVFQFDVQDAPPGLTNYWGYSPVSFFAPHLQYATRPDPIVALRELRDMVKALHAVDIEVILDVVYNHTAEGDEHGPTLCFKGLENAAYYLLHDGGYSNYSGTGNTLNGNQSIVRRMIRDSLHFWVSEVHVDGFRFDLASILSRDQSGLPVPDAPVLWDIETDPYLVGAKLIAEAWDASGLYQVGSFVGDRWREWNGRFRDDVRGFIKGDPGHAYTMRERFLASPDIYLHEQGSPEQSVNFVTCHDGFTLNDLVSYDEKHNRANREANRDGENHNLSWNCGVEGPTDDRVVEALRIQQIKNFFAVTLLSLGVPMLSMGDEVRRTQLGNNNAYCQDNELSWFDWRGVTEHAELLRFVRGLVHLRRSLSLFRDQRELSLEEFLETAPVRWHGVALDQPDWGDASRTLAFTAGGSRRMFHVILNAYWEPLTFQLPRSGRWRRLLDTSRPSPEDLCDEAVAPMVSEDLFTAAPRSTAVLVASLDPSARLSSQEDR